MKYILIHHYETVPATAYPFYSLDNALQEAHKPGRFNKSILQVDDDGELCGSLWFPARTSDELPQEPF